MKFDRKQIQRNQAAALLLVIAVVSLLGAIVIGLRLASQPSWDESTLDYMRSQARILAESGANLALHPDVQKGDPVLRKDFGDGRSFEVKIKTEGGRILVSTLNEEAVIEGVTELFILWGLDANNAAIAAESLADWVDTDTEARGNGAEQTFYAGLNYPQFPTNEPFSSLETMLLVRGMEVVAQFQPLWRDYFTIHGDGLIDLNSASIEIIEAFLQVPRDAAINFANYSNGEDGVPDTSDDEPVTDTAQARQILGMDEDEWNEKSALVTLEGSVRRIESIGRVGDHEVRLIILSNVTDDELASPVARYSE